MPVRRPFDPTVPICATLLAAAAAAVAFIAIQLRYGTDAWGRPDDVVDGRFEALALLLAMTVAAWLTARLQEPPRLRHWEPSRHTAFERWMLAFQGFGALAAGAIALGGVWFLLDEVEDRRDARIVRAYQLLTTAFASEESEKRDIGQVAALASLARAGVDLSHLNAEGRYLRGVDLSGARLRGAIFTRAKLAGARLTGAILMAVDLRGAELENVDFRGSYLRLAKLQNASLAGARFDLANLVGARLDEADAHVFGCSLPCTSFRGANLESASLIGADLRRAHFQDSHLAFTTFDKAHILGANFTNSGLLKTSFVGARFDVGEGYFGENPVGPWTVPQVDWKQILRNSCHTNSKYNISDLDEYLPAAVARDGTIVTVLRCR